MTDASDRIVQLHPGAAVASLAPASAAAEPSVAATGSAAGCDTVMTRGVGRPLGLPKTGGRKAGVRNKPSLSIQAFLAPCVPKAKRQLSAILSGKAPADPGMLRAIAFVIDQNFGKAVDRHEVSGPGGAPIASAAVVERRDPVADREAARSEARELGRLFNTIAVEAGRAPPIDPELLA